MFEPIDPRRRVIRLRNGLLADTASAMVSKYSTYPGGSGGRRIHQIDRRPGRCQGAGNSPGQLGARRKGEHATTAFLHARRNKRIRQFVCGATRKCERQGQVLTAFKIRSMLMHSRARGHRQERRRLPAQVPCLCKGRC